jgi:hypothetical protein
MSTPWGVRGKVAQADEQIALAERTVVVDLEPQHPLRGHLGGVKRVAVGREREAVRVMDVVRDFRDRPVGVDIKDSAIDRRGDVPDARCREVHATRGIGHGIVRPDEGPAGPVFGQRLQCLAGGRDLDQRVGVVADDQEVAVARLDHRGRPAALLTPHLRALLAVPAHHAIDSVLHVVQLPAVPQRPLRKRRHRNDDLDLTRRYAGAPR